MDQQPPRVSKSWNAGTKLLSLRSSGRIPFATETFGEVSHRKLALRRAPNEPREQWEGRPAARLAAGGEAPSSAAPPPPSAVAVVSRASSTRRCSALGLGSAHQSCASTVPNRIPERSLDHGVELDIVVCASQQPVWSEVCLCVKCQCVVS